MLLVRSSDERRLRSTVSAFADAEEAKREFAAARQRLGAAGGWVELSAVDEHGRLDRLHRSG